MSLDQLKIWHDAFAQRLICMIDGLESVSHCPTNIRDPRSSELGKWMQNQTGLAPLEEYQMLRNDLEKFHLLAHELLFLKRTGYKGCLKKPEGDFLTSAARVSASIDNFLTALS